MNLFRSVIGTSFFALILGYTSLGSKPAGGVKWKTDPFDHHLFIENEGQFDGTIPGGEKILYGVQLGRIQAYFTAKGLVYSYPEFPKMKESKEEEKDGDPDKEGLPKATMRYIKSTWDGSNADVTVEPSEELSSYYTYPKGTNASIKASTYRKITYKNIYPGIDIQYFFKEGKDGIEYSITLHPGADISMVKLSYSGAKDMKKNADGTITFGGRLGEFTEYSPTASYYGETNNITVACDIKGNAESFSIQQNYDRTKTLVIDPWVTNPSFASLNRAYDLDWDSLGNVYAYGGLPQFGSLTLVKMNSAGTILWTYVIGPLSGGYGDFCTDKHTGTCYIGKGANTGAAYKINTLGALTASFPGTTNMNEIWRMKYDACNHHIVLGGGGTAGTCQAGILDTNMTTVNPVNILGTGNFEHDISLLALDPNGTKCYMATAKDGSDPTNFNNVVMQLPLPSLAPTAYFAPDHFHFSEVSSVAYTNSTYNLLPYSTNGMNGAAASPNWLYLYNGDTLRQFNKNTGVINTQYPIRAINPIKWGGLDVDPCDNIYVGVADSLVILNSSFARLYSIKLPDSVYDIQLGRGNIIYTCGKGFVSEVNNPINPLTPGSTPTSCSACDGTATVNPCGVGPFTYVWNNAATTQTITGLCTGSYTVTVTNTSTCPPTVDTAVIVVGNVSNLSVTQTDVNPACSAPGNSTITPLGGTAPFTYLWSDGQTGQTATGLTAGTYTCSVTDNGGCSTTVSVTLANVSSLVIGDAETNPICSTPGSSTLTPSGGTAPYTYAWSNGQTGQTATGLTAGTYTCLVSDNGGCTGTASVTLVNSSSIVISDAETNPICLTPGSSTLTPSGGTAPYTYAWSNTQTGQTATGLTAGTYTCGVSDANGCSTTISVNLVNSGSISATHVETNPTCTTLGSSALTPSGGTAPYTYSWSDGQTGQTATGLSAGTYTCGISDANGCSTTASATLVNTGSLTVAHTETDPVCLTPGTSALTPSGGTAPYTYAWSNGQTGQTATGLTAGTYTCLVTDNGGCTGTVSVTLVNNSSLSVSLTSTDPGCAGSGNITANPSGGTAPYTYLWSTGATDQKDTGLTAGSFTCTVSDNNGCTTTASVSLTYNNVLAVNACCDDSIVQGDTISLVATGASNYVWTPTESLSCSNCANPIASPSVTTKYFVTASNGVCQGSDSVIIIIELPKYTLFIPKAFTPNGDGLNDLFKASGIEIKSFEMFIFDRWGTELFHGTDINIGWNGTFKGADCQEDAYVYSISAYDMQGNEHTYTGTVNLLR